MEAYLSRKTNVEHPVPQIEGTPEQQQAVHDLFYLFNVSTDKARTVVDQFIQEMKKGLDHEGATSNKLLCSITRLISMLISAHDS